MPTFTRVIAEDFPLVLGFMECFSRDLHLDWDHGRRESNLHHLAAHPAAGGVWLIRDVDGVAAGYLVLATLFSLEFGGTCLMLDELYVSEARQGRGLAAAALVEVDAIGRGFGARQIFLEAARDSPQIAAMYARRGFTRRPYQFYHRPVAESGRT